MKINHSQTTASKTHFTGYYSPQQVKNLEQYIYNSRKLNPNITGNDIIKMRESIASFNAFYEGTKTLNPERVSNDLYKKFQIPSDFRGDKILAGCSALAANIFHKLKLPQPKGIYKNTLNPGVLGNCNAYTRVLNFTDNFHWAEVQQEALEAKIRNHSSSGHFLKTFLHEFMHNYHVKRIQDIARSTNPTYEMQSIMNSAGFTAIKQQPYLETKMIAQNGAPITNLIAKTYIQQKLSAYGATLPAEMFAETGAKLIADSLDMKTLRPTHHPFAFKDFTQDKFLMQMMNDFYNGKFDKYI